ncbi:MAG TPA: hypothetical protein VMG35_16345 [Bryobacteraceae bacterium]|nr:hypothetical protein [Bryobacteraceae bacterium]
MRANRTVNGILLVVTATALTPAEVAAQSIFRAVPTPNENFNSGLYAVSASSPSDVWAVGQSAIHFDGASWTAFPMPMIKGNNTSSLGGVVDISPTEAWAVGTVNIGLAHPGQVIERWDGTQWSVFPGPSFAAGDQPSLNAMTAISANDIWAAGSLLNDGGQRLNLLFEHWDGSSWTPTARPANGFLFGVSADATNDVWAVGFSGAENDDSRTLVMHYDGISWKTVASPSVGNGANQLNGVVALAPDNVWAVGFSTPVAPPKEAPTLTLIEHWDGAGWTVVPSPNVGPKSIYQSNRLLGITAVSASDIWAFGSFFLANGSENQKTLLLHWDGNVWSIEPSPNPTKGGFLSDLLFAGVSPAPGNVWIVGVEDEAPHSGTLAIHSLTAAPER